MTLNLKSVKEISVETGIKVFRLYELIRQGILPAVRLGPRQVRISPEAIQEFIRNGGKSLPGDSKKEV